MSKTTRKNPRKDRIHHAYEKLRQLRGKVRFSRTLAELKAER